MTEIYTENEWAPLRSVIVGSADYANWPQSDPEFIASMTDSSNSSHPWTKTKFKFGPVDQEIIDRANYSLDQLSVVLTDLGVKVHRPQPRNYQQLDQFYGYCPRDTVLIIGNRIIASPTKYHSRRTEWQTMQHVWGNNTVCTVDDPAAVFDAANICRLGKDVLYLVSETGNTVGARWLQDFLGKEYCVHTIDNLYSGVHIDSTITPIREGLVVLNAGRVNHDNIPKLLHSWDKIWIHADELEHQPFKHYPYASNWIGLNFLTVNENLAIVDPKQKVLIEKLNAHRVECIGVDLTESRTLGGGHHCCTLDILRG